MGKNTARRARATLGDDGWGNVKEAPRLDVPDARKRILIRGATRVWVWGSLVATPVLALALASTLVTPGQGTGQAVTDQAVVSATDQVAKASAVQQMNAWLAADSPQLPGGRVLTVDDRVRRVDFNTAEERKAAQKKGATLLGGQLASVQIVDFTLADSVGNLYRSSVAVTVNANGVVTAVSAPSLERLPDVESVSGSTSDPWPGLSASRPSESVEKAVTAWAQAYTSGDAAALRQTIGDPDGSHLYVPLPQAAAVKVEAVAAAELAEADPEVPGRQVLAVRVNLTFAWTAEPGGKAGQVSSGTKETSSTALDVLVVRADTAAPQVVAWGAPGTGPQLEAFSNALAANSDSKDTGQVDAKAPSVSPSPPAVVTATPATAGGN